MSVIRHKLNEGELSISQQISERIRLMFGWDKEDFYSQTGHGCFLEEGFMRGLWLGCKGESGS